MSSKTPVAQKPPVEPSLTKDHKENTQPPAHILIVDDEQGYRDLLAFEFTRHGYSVTTAIDGQDGLEKVQATDFQLAICDINMPRLKGIELLQEVKRKRPNMEVIMATGYGTLESAVEAMKLGAYDFISKPFDLKQMWARVEKALEKNELKTMIGIYEASKAIFSSIKLDSLLPVILRLVVNVLKADDASLMLVEDDGSMTLAASTGLDDEVRRRTRVSLGERVAGKAALWNEPLIITGQLERDKRFSNIPSLRDIHSSIVYPLVIEGELIGVLNINRTRHEAAFGSTEMCSATILASQIAQALMNAKIFRKLELKVKELKQSYQKLERAQAQLIHSEKLAAVGQLAAGVAHELNNPLMAIMGFLQLIIDSNTLAPQQRSDVEAINKQTIRCRDIVRNLLQLSRKSEPKKEITPVVPLLKESLRLVKYDYRQAGIKWELNAPENLPAVLIDPGQLQQVILNLLTNARHAMEGQADKRLVIDIVHEHRRVYVHFRDTGCGIADENKEKIFDPFFTTKSTDHGTGLGLSVSLDLVRQNGGDITVESVVGEGATFTLELPIYGSQLAAA